MTKDYYLGIEIGGSKLQLVRTDQNATVIDQYTFTITKNAEAAEIRRYIEDSVTPLKAQGLTAIGVGFGGPLDYRSGKIWNSYQVSGWAGFPLKDWLEELSAAQVVADNDANMAAFGEARGGAAKGYDTSLYVTLGSGLGAGLVIKNQIYHGALPGEAELGHLRLNKKGETLESACSGWAVDAKVRNTAKLHPHSPLARLALSYPGAEAKALKEAIGQKDKFALQILEETCDDLAFGLSHAVHLLHPETIVLGGGLSLIGESILESVVPKLRNYLMDAFLPGPVIQLSSLKETAVPVGALLLAIECFGPHKPS